MKWKIRRIRSEDRKLASDLHKSVDLIVQGIKKRFRLWAKRNRLARVPTYNTFVLCAATMINCGLKPSSTKTYMTNVLRAFRWQMERETYTRCKHALSKWEYRGRHHVAKRASGLTLPQARTLATKMKNPFARLVVEIMSQTPLRLADLCDIHWNEVEVSKDMIIILLVGGKNRRSRIAQERLRLVKAELTVWLVKHLSEGKRTRPGTEHLVAFTTTTMNRILREVSGKEITTYSIRNAFHHDVIAQCTRNGVVNWTEVANRTLHRSDKTVKAHYDRS